MQLKNIADAGLDDANAHQPALLNNIEPTRLAVQSALTDLRAISSNLELPDIEDMGVPAIAERVVRDFQMKTGMNIKLDVRLEDVAASFRSKVSLYRLLQESLANSFRHAQCKDCSVVLRGNADNLTVEISDGGPGFDPAEAVKKRRLGLQSMRQRVEVLGGSFELASRPGSGTLIRAILPLASHGIQHD
jgi:signal transduction histidine kinase